MSPQERIGVALRRIASLTSIARVRTHEAEWRELNGGTNAEMQERLEGVATRLEKLANDLRATLA